MAFSKKRLKTYTPHDPTKDKGYKLRLLRSVFVSQEQKAVVATGKNYRVCFWHEPEPEKIRLVIMFMGAATCSMEYRLLDTLSHQVTIEQRSTHRGILTVVNAVMPRRFFYHAWEAFEQAKQKGVFAR